MPLSIYNFQNTVVFHRTALLNAIQTINHIKPEFKDIVVIVSTKNMILSLPFSIFLNRKTIINLVGFGRIFTDFGFIGRWFFNTVVKIYSLNSAQAFIVEHSTDKNIIQNLQKRMYLQLMVVDWTQAVLARQQKVKIIRITVLAI